MCVHANNGLSSKEQCYKPKENGELREGEVYNIITGALEERAVTKEQLLGFQHGDTTTPGVTKD